MRKTTAHYDTQRPLTAEERIFAEQNHDLLYIYCRRNGLPISEWYDILVIPYLQAVKKYFEVERLQQYVFATVLYKDLHRAVGNYHRAMTSEMRMPKGGLCTLDFEMEADSGRNQKNNIAEWCIDHNQQVEQEVIYQDMLFNILENLNGIQKQIFNMLIKEYNKSQIQRELKIERITLNIQMEKLMNIVRAYLN